MSNPAMLTALREAATQHRFPSTAFIGADLREADLSGLELTCFCFRTHLATRGSAGPRAISPLDLRWGGFQRRRLYVDEHPWLLVQRC